MKKDIGALFEELLNRFINRIEKNYQNKYAKAKDKEFVKEELKKGTAFLLDWLFLDPRSTKIFDAFWDRYKRGEDINWIITSITERFGDVDEILPYTKIDAGKKITVYISEEQRALKAFSLDERSLVKCLIRIIGYKEIKKRLPTMFDEKEIAPAEKIKAIYPIVKWTATKDNKNDFVQLIYSLHEAGFINGGKGEITKITESLAGVFGVNLGDNWQTNHSKSIHHANSGYEPPIFRKIKKAYQQYSESQIENKNKNT